MIPHKLNSKLLALALIGFILYILSNVLMSISQGGALESNLKKPAVTKEAAQEAAIRYAKDNLDFSAAGAEAMYQSDKYASGYIIKHRLLEQYEQDMKNAFPLDYWLILIRGADGDTLRLKVDMETPEVKGWDKAGEETKPQFIDSQGVDIAREAIQAAGYNPDDWAYAPDEASEDVSPLVFLSKTQKLGDAPLSISVGVHNGKAVSVVPGLKVPDAYMDWIQSQEGMARRMTVGFLLFTAAMGITALVLAIVYGRQVSWSRGIALSVIFFILYLIQNFNISDAALAPEGMDEQTRAIALMIMNIIVIFIAVLLAAAVWFCLLSGEQQWRKLGYSLWPRWRDGNFGSEMFYGMGRGYLICFFILGVQQVAFFIAGEAFDSFSISDPTQSTINMKWPYLFPATAWVAAIMEEAIYRLFGIALFKRILRNNFLALLVTSLIWGLGHTGYTIYPSYTRLFEVTLLGMIFGYVFLRYGFFTAVFAHAIMDSLLMGLYLIIEEPDPIHILWGVFYMVLPAIIGYAARFLHPRFGGRGKRVPPLPPEPRLNP